MILSSYNREYAHKKKDQRHPFQENEEGESTESHANSDAPGVWPRKVRYEWGRHWRLMSYLSLRPNTQQKQLDSQFTMTTGEAPSLV